MKVTLIAHTEFNYPTHVPWSPVADGHECSDPACSGFIERSADDLAEFSGRACYQSWGRPNPKTATNEGYLANILGMGHESVLEHASATFYIEGIGRSTTHELIRHRHLSYSQLSQRFVNESNAEMVVPPAIEALDEPAKTYALDHFYNATDIAVVEYQYLADKLTNAGLTRKQAREAARAVLPNATETKIVVTGNMRAWRDVLKKRHHVAADAEIQALAGELLRQLRGIAPNSFQDIPDEPYGSDS